MLSGDPRASKLRTRVGQIEEEGGNKAHHHHADRNAEPLRVVDVRCRLFVRRI